MKSRAMLFLHFRIGPDSFALGTEGILEVVPLAHLQPMRRAPEGFAGTLDYRGYFVPVVDLTLIETGRPAQRRISTRIVVLRHPAHPKQLIGLMAENATETLRLDPELFVPFAPGPHGLMQRVTVEDLVPASLLAFLSEDTGIHT